MTSDRDLGPVRGAGVLVLYSDGAVRGRIVFRNYHSALGFPFALVCGFRDAPEKSPANVFWTGFQGYLGPSGRSDSADDIGVFWSNPSVTTHWKTIGTESTLLCIASRYKYDSFGLLQDNVIKAMSPATSVNVL